MALEHLKSVRSWRETSAWFGRLRATLALWWQAQRTKSAVYRSATFQWWGDLDLAVRRVIVGLCICGAVLVAIGVFADLSGAWQNYPFVVNIASGIASACFGIPLALAVLRHLLNQQEDRSAALKLKRTAVASAKQFSDLVSLYWANQQLLETAEQQYSKAVELLEDCLLCAPVGERQVDGSTAEDNLPTYRSNLEKLVPILESASSAYGRGVLPSEELTRIEAEIQSTWRYLDDRLRPQLMEAGVTWISAVLLMYSRKSPWQPFKAITLNNDVRYESYGWYVQQLSLDLRCDEPWDLARRDVNGQRLVEVLAASRAKLQSIRDLRELTAFATAVLKELTNTPPPDVFRNLPLHRLC